MTRLHYPLKGEKGFEYISDDLIVHIVGNNGCLLYVGLGYLKSRLLFCPLPRLSGLLQ